MAQIPILSGIVADRGADFVRSYPINLFPIVENLTGEGTGISKGYLKLAPGVRVTAVTPPDRGGKVWRGVHYRVIGARLVRVSLSGQVTNIGAIAGAEPVQFAESFDYLAIVGGGRLYYWNGQTLTEVTDPDLGQARSVAWLDGYFLTTDATNIVATELNNPTSVDPLKYGSSEANPDPVIGLLELRGQLYALNRYTIEVFSNGGGTGFPFRRERGSQIPKGCVGRNAYSLFVETFAFVGSGPGEAPGVYLAGAGQAVPIGSRELSKELASLAPAELSEIEVESATMDGQTRLYVHLPEQTWVYHWTASQQLDFPVWTQLQGDGGNYPARHLTWAGNSWWAGSVNSIGEVDSDIVTALGQTVDWRFDVSLLYNAGAGAIIHALELVTLGGRGVEAPQINLSWSDDGLTYGQERGSLTGARGDRTARPAWRRLGRMRNWRTMRFRGRAESPIAFARLEAQLEPLSA